jgi:hypothetical protein
MSGFARLLAAACVAAALTASATGGTSPARSLPLDLTTASLHDADTRLAAPRVLLRRRDCSKWWTCGPFKREKPRLA